MRSYLLRRLTIGTTNLSGGENRNPFAETRNNQISHDNTILVQSGNLMLPKKADVLNMNICAHTAEGDMILIDPVSIELIILPE
ncbi:MAG: hypothetical protein A2Z14_01910 [Chloroflexi bacterium RBG_16_48_8]|nr:MAG: hypothetical protein A2Z14_01910 [Chloroflexi bacterium RBG_16_48_8]